jgi:hypothetical protein
VEATGGRVRAAGLLFASLLLGCTSTPLRHDDTGGSSGGGASRGDNAGNGGTAAPGSSTGGMPPSLGAGGFIGQPTSHTGSCVFPLDNPSSAVGVRCPTPSAPPSACTSDCCESCGIDATGTNRCVCDVATGTYSSCTCTPPPGFPTGLSGGSCSPQGYAATIPPTGAPAGAMSLKGIPCTKNNAVCFTAESTVDSPRGCICLGGVMHCGSVHDWFTFSGGDTPYN